MDRVHAALYSTTPVSAQHALQCIRLAFDPYSFTSGRSVCCLRTLQWSQVERATATLPSGPPPI